MLKDEAKSKHKMHELIKAATMDVSILFNKYSTQDIEVQNINK